MALDPATVDRLAEIFAQGATNKAARRELGIDVATAARYRTKLGYGPAPQPTPAHRSPLTLAEKWASLARTVEGGHMQWTGRHRTDTGTRVLTHHGREHSARATAFRLATGRAPIGYVTAECDRPEWCVAPDHMADEPTRTAFRAELSTLAGRAAPRPFCDNGHRAADHVRYARDGRAYCATCHAARATARKATA